MPNLDYVRWLRARVGRSKVILVYASAIIPAGEGRILLQRRSDFAWWGLPGGVLERGEGLEDCLVREVREETGLHAVPERLVGIYSSPDFDVTYPNGDQVQQFTACFTCRVTGGTLQPDGGECLELAPFAPNRLPQVPSWYQAMIEDFTGPEEPSFRRGRPGTPTSNDYALWLRQRVGTAPLILTGAAACVWDDEERLLLVRRADNGHWSLPAGIMELGERIDRTAVREVREETGLDVKPERLVGVYTGPEVFHVYPNGDQVHVVSACFSCHVSGGSLHADEREVLDARFFPLDRLPPLSSRHRIRIDDAKAKPASAQG